MKRILLGLSLIFGISGHASSMDLLRPCLNTFNTPKNRAFGCMLAGGGSALILGVTGFPVAALAAVVCGGMGFTYHCVQGVVPELQTARQYLDQAKTDLIETQRISGSNNNLIAELTGDIGSIRQDLVAITQAINSQKALIESASAQAQVQHDAHITSIQARIAQVQAMQTENSAQVQKDREFRELLAGQQKTVEGLIAAGQQLSEEQKQQLEEMQLVNNQIAELMRSVQARARRRSNSGDSDASSTSMSSGGASSVRPRLRLVRSARDAQMSLWSVGTRTTPLSSAGFASTGGVSPRDVLQQAAERAQGRAVSS